MFADTGNSTELDTTRWIMKFSEVLEALDSANPDGVQMLLRWNSSEKEVSYVVSKVQSCLSSSMLASDLASYL